MGEKRTYHLNDRHCINRRVKVRTSLVVLLIVLAAILGFFLASWQSARKTEKLSERLLETEAEVECARYWHIRSGIVDARYQFGKGRRSLLEVVGAEDPSIDYEVAGIRRGVSVPTTRNSVLRGPDLQKLGIKPTQLSPGSLCHSGRLSYARDYNVELMRLVGRADETYPLGISPEILNMDRSAAN